MTVQMERLQRDFEIGPMYQAHFVGRDLQLFVTPVNANVTLVALVENPVTPATITMHLLALARDAVPLLDQPEDEEPDIEEPEAEESEEQKREEQKPDETESQKPESGETESAEQKSEETESEETESEETNAEGDSRVEAVAAPHDS